MLICLEGANGVGKSTIIERLRIDFPDAIFTHLPGATKLGKILRPIVRKTGEWVDLNDQTAFLLYAAEMHDFVASLAEMKDQLVFCDRWMLSTWVYQAPLVGPELTYQCLPKFCPDLLIYFTGDPVQCLKRAKGDSGWEKDDKALIRYNLYQQLITGTHPWWNKYIANQCIGTVGTINVDGSINNVYDQVIQIIDSYTKIIDMQKIDAEEEETHHES
ncbi:MAG: AAA family ATPase [Candidatus Saccharimonadales bacterium]